MMDDPETGTGKKIGVDSGEQKREISANHGIAPIAAGAAQGHAGRWESR